MAAVALAEVASEKYYIYEKGEPVYCCKPCARISHVYIYAKDSYSFSDAPNKRSSQYLGHWNKHGLILVPAAVVADVANTVTGPRGTDLQFGDHPETDFFAPSLYANWFKGPVNVMNGLIRTFRNRDIYYPVRNSDYNTWRNKFNRGGDFVVYSTLKRIKLARPIELTMDQICKPSKQ